MAAGHTYIAVMLPPLPELRQASMTRASVFQCLSLRQLGDRADLFTDQRRLSPNFVVQ